MKTFRDKLNKADLKHLRETTEKGTLREFKRNRAIQIRDNITCFDCRIIARKLGLED